MNEKINIKKMDGTTISADLICIIENTQTNKRYVYYTLNETVGTGDSSTVKIYVSKIQQNNPTLDTPITEEDWNKLKSYMGDALKGNNNTEIRYISLSEIGELISISEKAIAMPVSYDYINKQRGIYAANVATATQVAPTATSVPEQPQVQPPVVEPIEPVETATVEPVIEAPVAPEVSAPESVIETPVTVEEPTVVPIVEDSETETSTTMTPIDLSLIEQKYSEMIETINKLKEQELEAAKRYNATIELSTMHKEQHANYVQNEQIKENIVEPLIIPNIEEAPVVNNNFPTEPVLGTISTAENATGPIFNLDTNPSPIMGAPIEPSTITPVVPEPVPATSVDLETNWFDMPANNA